MKNLCGGTLLTLSQPRAHMRPYKKACTLSNLILTLNIKTTYKFTFNYTAGWIKELIMVKGVYIICNSFSTQACWWIPGLRLRLTRRGYLLALKAGQSHAPRPRPPDQRPLSSSRRRGAARSTRSLSPTKVGDSVGCHALNLAVWLQASFRYYRRKVYIS